MRHLLTIVCVLAISELCQAEEPGVIAADPAQGDRIAALRRAAHHLDAAGLPDEAARVRAIEDEMHSSAHAERQEFLREKQARLAELQAEIAALLAAVDPATSPAAPAQQVQVLLEVQILELDRQRLRNLGIAWPTDEALPHVLDSTDDVGELVVACDDAGSQN